MSTTPEPTTIAELQDIYNNLCRRYLTEKPPRRIKQLMSSMRTVIRETRRRDAGKHKVAISHVNAQGHAIRETRFAYTYEERKNVSNRKVHVHWAGHSYTLPGSKEVFHTEPPANRREYWATEAGPLVRANHDLRGLSKKERRLVF